MFKMLMLHISRFFFYGLNNYHEDVQFTKLDVGSTWRSGPTDCEDLGSTPMEKKQLRGWLFKKPYLHCFTDSFQCNKNNFEI